MKEATSNSEKIFKSIRSASIDQYEREFGLIDFDTDVFQREDESLDILFAQNFVKAAGQFIYCENNDELVSFLQALVTEKKWEQISVFDPKVQSLLSGSQIRVDHQIEHLSNTQVGISGCESLIARLGSVLVSSGLFSGRRLNVFPETHIIIATTSQIVYDLKDALVNIKKKYNRLPSMISVISGPSRTADIEKTLVMGAHGPRNLYVFLLDDLQTL